MKFIHKISQITIFLAFFMMAILIVLINLKCPIWLLTIYAVICALFFFAEWYIFYRPFKHNRRLIEEILDSDEETIITTAKLNEVLEQDVDGENLKTFIQQYINQKTRENTTQVFNKQARLTALQSQINPHFLYNTLESIRGQALLDGNVEIAKMVETLGAFFRYSISRKGDLVTLRDELNNIKNYITIQRYRFNNRFCMEIYIDEEDECAYDFLIPKLIIQPVIENSIFHGLEEKASGGKVTIEIIVSNKNLIIQISDNGKGMDAKALRELNDRIYGKTEISDKDAPYLNTGIALPNINKRIQLLFGEQYGLQVYSTPGQGTDVEIIIPADYKPETG